ncbi:MAG: polysaccharide biosynthesis C-terminal domain-containing protein [Clostridia bacterium]|nr:polysaccharide biosynthesis C-terminal domain-containing protein [Clostridia bacterium]MBQ9774363.1 polysaccharide biosynthesis C-terminal domain-containing protein [Clostridia bacterium]
MVKDLTQGRPVKVITMFALSMLASSMMSYVYSTTDSMMVSHFVNTHALGALSAVTPAIGMIDGFLASTVGGFAIFAGRVFGAGDHQRLRKLMANASMLTAVVVIPVAILMCVFCNQIVALMNTPESFRATATTYFTIVIAGMPISAISWVCASMFRALGDNKTPLMISGLCGALNVVFNFIFLVPCGMDVAGAALGTVCATAVGSTLYVIFLKKRMPLLLFGRADMHFSRPILRILLSNGIPMGLLSSVISVGSLILQIAINGHAPEVITGIATGGRLLSIIWIFIQVFESALVYFCAQNLGAGRYDRVREGYRVTMVIMLILGAVCAAFSIFCGEFFHRLYAGWGQDAETNAIVRYAEEYIFTQVIFFPFMAGLCGPRGALKGIGNTVPAVMCGVIELVARIAVSLISVLAPLATEIKLGLLYFAGPAAWVGATVFLLILLPRAFRHMECLHSSKEELSAQLDAAEAEEKHHSRT